MIGIVREPLRIREDNMSSQELDREVSVFAQYYLGLPASSTITERYRTYLDLYPVNISLRDERLVQFAIKYPWLIRFLDAGLAILSPHSELRRRLYIMFALLESDKTYASLFLSKKRAGWYVVRIIGTGINAVIKTVLGIVLVKMVIK
jgi:hypothetical protein